MSKPKTSLDKALQGNAPAREQTLDRNEKQVARTEKAVARPPAAGARDATGINPDKHDTIDPRMKYLRPA